MKKTITIIAAILFLVNVICAQDFHFSQYNTAPLALNPGKTGLIDGNHRLALKVRDQWSSVLRERAYKTAYLSYDAQACIGGSKSFFGVGFTGLYDQAGTHVYQTFSGNANFAYHQYVSRNAYVVIGMQLGVLSYAIGKQAFEFDEQFGNFGFDPTANDFENFESFSTNLMLDVSPGLMYYDTDLKIQVGIAAFHVNKPAYSFIGLTQINDPRVQPRLVFHASAPVKSTRKNNLIIQQIFMTQKLIPNILYWQSVTSVHWKHQLGNITSNHIRVGLGGRLNRNISTQKPIVDALIIYTQLDLHPLSIGLSYDVNLSPLSQVSLFRSGPEISVMYNFDDKWKCVNCKGF